MRPPDPPSPGTPERCAGERCWRSGGTRSVPGRSPARWTGASTPRPEVSGRSGEPVGLGEPLPRRLDLLDRVLAREPAAYLHLLVLELLVDGEEVRDLVLKLIWNLVERLECVPAWIGQRDREHLVVDAGVVLHAKQRDRLDHDQAAGEGGLGDADHHVERVPVERERVRDEAVVGRIDGRGEEEPVEPDDVALVVVLVLVPAPLGDLDDAVEGVGRHAAQRIPLPGAGGTGGASPRMLTPRGPPGPPRTPRSPPARRSRSRSGAA